MHCKTYPALAAIVIGCLAANGQAATAIPLAAGNQKKLSQILAAAAPAKVAASARVKANAVRPLIPLASNTAGMCSASLAAAGNGRKLWAIYMIGADLESRSAFGTENLQQLVAGWQQLAARDNVDVVLAFGGAEKDGWRGIKYANMAQIVADSADGIFGNASDYLYSDAQTDMGKQATLEAFLTYVNDRYGQGSRRFLSFWDHGSSYNSEPGIGSDETTGTVLGVNEINNAMARTASCYHLIGYDACLMATMESAVAMQDFGQYLVASEELEPGHGWNYAHVLDALANQSTNLGVGRAMVDSFVNNANYAKPESGKTLSVLDLSQVRNTIQTLDVVGPQLASSMNSGSEQAVIRAFYNVQQYGANLTVDSSVIPAHASFDLKDLLSLVSTRSQNAALNQGIADASAAITRLVAYTGNDGSRPYSTGVAIAPLDMKVTHAAEQVNAGLINAGWGQAINAFHALKQRASAPVAGAVHTALAGSGLRYLSARDGSVDTATAADLAAEQGAVASFTSPYLAEVRGSIGAVTSDGGLIVLGEQPAYETDGGSYFYPQWNGQGPALVSSADTVYIPLFISQVANSGLALNTVVTLERPGIAEPLLGLLMAQSSGGSFDYTIKSIEQAGSGVVLGSVDESVRAGDTLTVYTLKLKPNGGSEVIVLSKHTFAATPTLGEVPLTHGNYGYTLTGYSVGDVPGMAAIQSVAVEDRLLNWGAATYPGFHLGTNSRLLHGYYSRCNANQSICAGAKDGYGWYYDGSTIQNLGTLDSLLPQARAAGF